MFQNHAFTSKSSLPVIIPVRKKKICKSRAGRRVEKGLGVCYEVRCDMTLHPPTKLILVTSKRHPNHQPPRTDSIEADTHSPPPRWGGVYHTHTHTHTHGTWLLRWGVNHRGMIEWRLGDVHSASCAFAAGTWLTEGGARGGFREELFWNWWKLLLKNFAVDYLPVLAVGLTDWWFCVES